LNGEKWPGAKPAVLGDALDCNVVAFALPTEAEIVIEVDELCLFDRALTDDEVKRLAGQAKK